MIGPKRPAAPPLGLYIHFPWCIHRCPYCDYNAHEAAGPMPQDEYVAALRADLESSVAQVLGREVVSIYIGGGTPSLLAPELVEQILSDVRMLLPMRPDAEITLEANPGANPDSFAAFVDAGVCRFSLGIQSLADANLRVLERTHDAQEAMDAVAAAIASRARVNLDLITALPNQSLDDAVAEAEQLAALGAEHLSIYRLTLEAGTQFFRKPPAGMPDDDLAAEIEDATAAAAATAGYQQYEVSAFARSDQARCMHNLNYWTFGDYLGIGAGAHSKLTLDAGIIRQTRHKAPARYMAATLAGQGPASSRRLAADDLVCEFMLNAFRLTDGFDLSLFAQRTGLAAGMLASPMQQARERGLVDESSGRIKPSQRGFELLNDLCQLFMPDQRVPLTQS